MKNQIALKSIVATMHDTGSAPGCLPYKIIVIVQLPITAFNKLCPVSGRSQPRKSRKTRDLGNLVLTVNNMLYAFNKYIPAYNPLIDSDGHTKAKSGIKTLKFEYFMGKQDWQRAEALGYEHFKLNGEVVAKSLNCFNIQGA